MGPRDSGWYVRDGELWAARTCGGRDGVLRGAIFTSSHPIVPPCSPKLGCPCPPARPALPGPETTLMRMKYLGSLSNASAQSWGGVLLSTGLRLYDQVTLTSQNRRVDPRLAQHGGQGSCLSFPAQHFAAPQTPSPALIPICLVGDLILCLSFSNPFPRVWSLLSRSPRACCWSLGRRPFVGTPAPFPWVLEPSPFLRACQPVWLWLQLVSHLSLSFFPFSFHIHSIDWKVWSSG